jgi:hypothetical protein
MKNQVIHDTWIRKCIDWNQCFYEGREAEKKANDSCPELSVYDTVCHQADQCAHSYPIPPSPNNTAMVADPYLWLMDPDSPMRILLFSSVTFEKSTKNNFLQGSGSGAGSRSLSLTYRSESGRPKNIWILRMQIRIRKTDRLYNFLLDMSNCAYQCSGSLTFRYGISDLRIWIWTWIGL